MLRNIELHGVLGDKFGKYFQLDVESVQEVCEALSYQVDGFRKFMLTSKQSGMDFAVFLDDVNIGEEEIGMRTGAKVIRIVPKITGSGGDSLGILQVVAGVALIGLSVTPFGSPFSSALMGTGAGILVGGASTLLMPTPKIKPRDPSENKPNYGYGGSVTSVKSGNCVPLQYGRGRIGGHLLGGLSVSEDT